MTELTRRTFLAATGGSIVAAACAPGAGPGGDAPMSGIEAWHAEWEQLVVAAKKEGKLVLLTRPGAGYRKALESFEAAFPGIEIEHTSMTSVQFVPRFTQERQAGLYTLDMMVSTFGPGNRGLIEAGAFDPVGPAIFRPDVKDDAVWYGGFEDGFVDRHKKFAFGFVNLRRKPIWINTNFVKDGEIKTATDLLNPKWKGKIVAADPRPAGFGATAGTVMRLALGDDVIRRFFKDQEVLLQKDYRPMMDTLIKGQYAVGFNAVSETLMDEYLAQGVGKHLKSIEVENVDHITIANETAYIVNKAPHPNAAKLFLNWLLTKEGQKVWCDNAESNSRRLDVPVLREDLVPTPGKTYVRVDLEEFTVEIDKTQQIALQVLN